MEHTKMSDRINSYTTQEFLDESIRDIKTDFTGRLVTIIIAALGLITALAWDRTLEDLFTEFFGPLDSLSHKLMYASIVTVLAVFATVLLRKFFIKEKEKNVSQSQNVLPPPK